MKFIPVNTEFIPSNPEFIDFCIAPNKIQKNLLATGSLSGVISGGEQSPAAR